MNCNRVGLVCMMGMMGVFVLSMVENADAHCVLSRDFSQAHLGETLHDSQGNYYQVKIPESLESDRNYVRLVGEGRGAPTLWNYGKRVDLYEEVIRDAVLQPLFSDLWFRNLGQSLTGAWDQGTETGQQISTLFSIASDLASVSPHVRDLTNLRYIPGGTASRDLVNTLKVHGRSVRHVFGGQGRAMGALSGAVDIMAAVGQVGDVALTTAVLQALANDEADLRLSELEALIRGLSSPDPAMIEALSRVRGNIDVMMQESTWRDFLGAMSVAIDDNKLDLLSTGVIGLLAHLPHGWAFALEFKVIMGIYNQEELARRACLSGELWGILHKSSQANSSCMISVKAHLGVQFYDYMIRAFSTGEAKFRDFVNSILLLGKRYEQWVEYYEGTKEDCTRGYAPGVCQPLQAGGLGGPIIAGNTTILFLLDTSGSMKDRCPGSSQRKIDAAKEALAIAVEQFSQSPGNEFGVLAFGGRCATRLICDFGRDAAAITAAIGPLEPEGKTPIESAIREGARILRSRPQSSELSLILISDGMETCGGDPVTAARELNVGILGPLSGLMELLGSTVYAAAQTRPIRLSVIAFDVEPEAQRQLEAIAQAAQGSFHRADNLPQLTRALTRATNEIHYWPGQVHPQPVTPESHRIVVRYGRDTDPLWYVLGGLWAVIILLGAGTLVLFNRGRRMASPTVVGLLLVKGVEREHYVLTKRISTLGRSVGNDVAIQDEKMSGRHARIECNKQGFRIVDLGSTNGTYVNDQKVHEASLRPGDVIRMGETTLEFRLPEG